MRVRRNTSECEKNSKEKYERNEYNQQKTEKVCKKNTEQTIIYIKREKK